jgi:predicted porin
VSDEVKALLEGNRSSDQTSVGIDGELARGSWILRGEAIWSAWDAPALATGPLGSFGFTAEGRYKVQAGLFLAARISGLRYESVSSDARTETWDANVTRFEGGVGYSFHRNVLGKFVIQYNERDATRVPSRWIPALQLLFWF